MKEQIDILKKLQQIETESDKTRAMLRNVPQKLEELDAKLNLFEQSIAEKTVLQDELQKKYRSYEGDFQTNLSKIKKKEEALGTVKTNKEYQTLLKEIDELKKKTSDIEDEMITFLDQADSEKKAIEAIKKEYSAIKAQVAQEKRRVRHQADEEKKKLEKFDAEWNNISQMLESDLLNKFVMVKSRLGGVAIAPVKNAICQGCHLNIPPQMYNELQRFDTLRFCPNCQRMIYYEETQMAEAN